MAIAIKANIFHEINNIFRDNDENVIHLQVKIQGSDLNLIGIYGPNSNDIEFYRQIKARSEMNGHNTIISGDFNTILDNRGRDLSIDRIGDGACPNPQNSRYLNEWIDGGDIVDPFRVLYPEKVEYSYTLFRRDDNIGKNRLDFFLISRNILSAIKNVRYEDRLGRDFDHREVTLIMGGHDKVRKEQIFKETVNDERAKYVGAIAFYETVNGHMRVPNEGLKESIGQAELVLREIESLKKSEKWEEIPRRKGELEAIMGILPNVNEILGSELTCDKRTLYEVTLMAIKNRLIGIQVNNRLKEGKIRKELGEQLLLYEQLDGVNSEGWKRVNEDILTLNDRDLKRRAGKYREFFEQNNEKPTSIFYRLGKEKNGDDDTAQIRDNDGKVFESNSRREEHISKFYENLYKKE